MITKIQKHFPLLFVIVLAAFLRLWNLQQVPPSVSMDEASIGWNAYSVSEIGVDEYNEFPLISQRGYDDWRRSTYLFLVVPFVKLLGLQAISIRLPAVILSVLSVFASYFIILFLFKSQSNYSRLVATIGSLLLSLSPWHIYISRLGHESNAYVSFFIFGVLFFLIGLQKFRFMVLSWICFTLSMISYYAGQVIVPLFIVGVIVLYRSVLVTIIKKDIRVLWIILFYAVLVIPIILNIFSPSALVRYRGTSTFSPDSHAQEYARLVQLRNDAVIRHDFLGQIVFNRRFFPIRVFIDGYKSHFAYNWLFKNSGSESFKIPGLGLIYIWEFPFILFGLLLFIKQTSIDARTKSLIFLWILLAPFPASIATQAPHAMRSYAFLPTWQLLAAFGIAGVFSNLKLSKWMMVAFLTIIILYCLSLLNKNYFMRFPREQSRSFQYAFSQMMPYLTKNGYRYANIIVSNNENLYQSYMLYLYYSQYNPILYRSMGGTISGGYAQYHTIGNISFRPLNKEKMVKNTLYLSNPNELLDGKVIAKFYNLDGAVAIVAKVL